MLKIAVVTRYFPNSEQPTHGRSAYQTLRVLAREADVRVFYPNSTYPSFLKPQNRTYNKLDPTYSLPDVKVNYYDYPALPLISRPFNGWMVARTLLPHVRSFAPDLIFSFILYPYGYAAMQIGQALSVPVVVMGIGSDIHRIGDRFSAMHTRTVLHGVDFLVAVSDDLRRKAVAMGAPPEKTRAIVNGCDLSVFQVRDRGEARQQLEIGPASEAVVYIGRMDVKKGLRELIEAAAALHPHRPGLQVYLVGEGPDLHLIKSVIRASGAAGYIHLRPPCAFDDVATWIAASDLVTLPSYMEGCPNVVLEALACGRPVVATNVGGIPEIMSEDCGSLVPPGEPAELARALASVLDRTWDAAAISAHWSRSWSMVAKELLCIFEKLVSDRQAAVHGQ
ncbi:MAG: glycosyltransferase [Acidobacteriaceae bacterium]|jgi:glycosyltransferase involved in cell wall biosynthesis